MANQLHSRISVLASSFVDSVLEAVKSSSLQEILDGSSAHRPAPRARRRALAPPSPRRSDAGDSKRAPSTTVGGGHRQDAGGRRIVARQSKERPAGGADPDGAQHAGKGAAAHPQGGTEPKEDPRRRPEAGDDVLRQIGSLRNLLATRAKRTQGNGSRRGPERPFAESLSRRPQPFHSGAARAPLPRRAPAGARAEAWRLGTSGCSGSLATAVAPPRRLAATADLLRRRLSPRSSPAGRPAPKKPPRRRPGRQADARSNWPVCAGRATTAIERAQPLRWRG